MAVASDTQHIDLSRLPEALRGGRVAYAPEIDELTVLLPRAADAASGGAEFARDSGLADPQDYVLLERDRLTGALLSVTVQPFTAWLAETLAAAQTRPRPTGLG
jgi:hypothetical protein